MSAGCAETPSFERDCQGIAGQDRAFVKGFDSGTQSSTRKTRTSWRSWVPAMALVIVALVQVMLTQTAALSPWKGGGFGMFATIDGTAFRHVRIFVESDGNSEEVELSPSLEDPAARAQLLPSDAMLEQLASAVVLREMRRGRAVTAVRLEVWRTNFSAPSLEAEDRPIRAFDFYVDQTLEKPE